MVFSGGRSHDLDGQILSDLWHFGDHGGGVGKKLARVYPHQVPSSLACASGSSSSSDSIVRDSQSLLESMYRVVNSYRA